MSGDDASLLRNKRDATRYQILVEIAERQPAVSQREVAEAIGITAQAVSDYVGDLVDAGYVETHGRGRYEVTKEGVDWLISRTDALREFATHVAEDVIGHVEVETALATAAVAEGETVTLTMRDGALHATPGDLGGATAVAVTAAPAGREVGVTNFEGVVDYDLGAVTAVDVPRVRDGGSRTVDAERVADLAAANDLVAAAGVEALALCRAAGVDPDLRFGTSDAVPEAAMKGLDVLLCCTTTLLSGHTDRLREASVAYEVVDA
ncbi:MAG: MarR family transcriptional regulator [Haloferacaceae archaeon]|jgi:putative transcriptional regulator